MPIYDYNCPTCGFLSSLVRSYDDYTVACPTCGGTAERIPVYRSQGCVIRGGPNATMPPSPQTKADHQEVDAMLSKEMAKRNYPTDRVYDDLRNNRAENADGHIGIDYSKMPQSI